jgi:hypothetical protein
MKITIIKYSIIIMILALNACDKKKDTTPVLPPETQEGKNTFGCLVDNKIWINEGSSQFSVENIIINHLFNGLSLNIYNIDDKQKINESMWITIQQPIKTGLYNMKSTAIQAGLSNATNQCYYRTDTSQNVGMLEITKYDTIQKIISGRFNFNVHLYYHQSFNDNSNDTFKTILTITEGRFDIHYY